MNEIKKEYGWITAITPEEIKALGQAQKEDQFLLCEKWLPTYETWIGRTWMEKGNPVRRPIAPGEDWEIVPPDETETNGMEFYLDGKWHSNQYYMNGKKCGDYSIKDNPYGQIYAFRRRKSKSSPAMDDGWELVPKGEIKLNEKHPSWQFLGPSGNWLASDGVDPKLTYRRPKSKPVEQWGWLKVGCGVEMPFDTPINARLKNGEMRIVMRRITGEVVFFSSHHPIPAPVAYWHRTGPAPEADKFDPCEEAFNGLMPTPAMSQEAFDRDTFNKGWQACCDHYKVGDQSKGAN